MMEYRFSNLLTTTLVIILYGNSLPLLYPLGALVLGTAFWVDKWYILSNMYRKPY
jgi:hypothetical protein